MPATVPQGAPDHVVSHLSAAVLHALPLLGRPPVRVHLTRHGVAGDHQPGVLHVQVTPLTADDVVVRHGRRVTSVARTIIDVACTSGLHQALCLADDALRRGLTTKDVLIRALDLGGRRRGSSTARRVIALADGRSGSPGETLSRLRMRSAGIPTPTLQFDVPGAGGVVGRADFAWEEQRVLGEFDHVAGSGLPAPAGEAAVDRENSRDRAERDQMMGDLGWQVLRWGWRDLDDPVGLPARIRATLSRTGQRTG